MIDKRLLNMVGGDIKYIYLNVLFQWLSLAGNIVMMYFISDMLMKLFQRNARAMDIWIALIVSVVVLIVRYICSKASTRMSFLSSKAVKKTFRTKIYEKLLRLGSSYQEQVKSSEVVQVTVEGVDQLETYFGAYIPQFFYAMIAPLTLMLVIGFTVNWFSAGMLFLAVWMIPIIIMAIQTWAKKLLSKYLDRYYTMGDTFLENLQGMTTLKIYQADERKSQEMDVQAEKFRKITMKVLTMQLNSVTIMDFVTYAGSALGVILAVTRLRAGTIDLAGALFIILLAIEFFMPMRKLGSYFHIAMNGMTASKKMFKLLDTPEPEQGAKEMDTDAGIHLKDICFSYTEDKEVLHNINMDFEKGSFTGIGGESGCGKSTVAALLMARNKGFSGSLLLGDDSIAEVSEQSLLKNITYIGNDSFLFQGTVRDNLLMAKPDATDEELWDALKQANLDAFLREEQGLETTLTEHAANLSGGQRQRLALARALLHDSPVYIFDEATSNIDVESEESIMEQVHRMVGEKTVILISHRLANVTDAENIYVMEDGNVVEQGSHKELLENGGAYSKLWNTQFALENYAKEGAAV